MRDNSRKKEVCEEEECKEECQENEEEYE